ncbi:hypothetical protein AMS58_04500 [Pseudoalteromonas porphyrae]|uniref:hypothetical protein n=1 Tax=Pseudoalteromonas porphyrae TaxID=187330 RepID=UPI0006BB3EF6|nr:hypothetical protein [Pseudoalteromonas porphyrae]KPH95940.1 hypothetical protein AMS58_04500 [Pseudoalteromonas porphyrae]
MLGKLTQCLLLCALLLSGHTLANDFSNFEVKQGKGQFSQAKHFTFLKRAIKSQGEFVIYEQHVYWHTINPVSSEMLLLPSGIYRRLNTEKAYQTVTKDKQLNRLLAKLLSGEIDEHDWKITAIEQCYKLIPKLDDVALLFAVVELCSADENHRRIVITDQQKNETHISMQITSKELTEGDMNAVKLTH